MFIKTISAHRSDLTTAIDTLSNRGSAINGNCRVATHQCGVAMCLQAGTGTINATRDCGVTCSVSDAYLHISIFFHTADLATAINVFVHLSVADTDLRFLHHGLLTLEGDSLTLTGSEHMALSLTASDRHLSQTIQILGV